MVNKRLINTGVEAAPAAFDPLQNFETVTYTGNGSTQKITGYIRKGAAFNGSSSKITIPEISPESVSMWVNLDTLDRYDALLGHSTNTANYIYWADSSESYQLRLGNLLFGSGTAKNTVGAVGSWVNVVFVDNGSGTVTCYIDGSSAGSVSGSLSSYNEIGARTASTDQYLKGKIDQVRIFNTAITDTAKISQLADEEYGDAKNSVTDFFGNGTGVALYQLDDSANDTGGVSGKFDGSSAHFNGTDSSVGNTSIDTATTKAVSIWVNAADFSERWPFQQGDGQGVENFIRFYNTDDIQVRWGNVTQTFSGYSADTWYHIVAQTDASGNANVWINGTEVGTSTAPSTLTVDSTNIGRRKNGATWQYYFKGRIDDVRIYSDTLTDAEIGYLYNNTTASIPTDNLTAYYKFNGDATDETTNHDGTESNVTYGYNGTPTNVNFLGMAFQPDLVWIKPRSIADNNNLFDSIRGVTKQLISNNTSAESTQANTLTSFDSNGFTTGPDNNTNTNGATHVAWCWKAGGTAVSNTDGSITSTVSANQDAGFSIVGWNNSTSGTGNFTLGHGLSSTPELIIVKSRDTVDRWTIYSAPTGAQNYLQFSSAAVSSYSRAFPVVPTSSVFTLDNGWPPFQGDDMIAYCFHSVDGYQKVGVYSGTGTGTNAIATGFIPRFVMIKRTDSAGYWVIIDSLRENGDKWLYANTSDAEYDDANLYTEISATDGFIVYGSSGYVNASGTDNYIYLAIA